jgi:hypothetical protein
VSLGTFAGNACARARVNVPAWGCWWAGVDLAEPETVAGATSLVLAGQAMACAVMSGGAADGRAAYRAVSGAGGWGKAITKKSYLDDSGVALSKVLGDLAREVGETIADVPNTRLGPHYARPDGYAYEVLNLLAPKNWYVDFAGVTRIGQRPTAAYSGDAPRVRRDPYLGVIDLAVDKLDGLLPGVTIDGSQPATDVEYDLTPDRLTARVYAGAGSSTTARLELYAQLLAGLDPRARYRGCFEYRVVTTSGNRFNLQPVRLATGLDDLAAVPVRGPAGVSATVTLGETVLVVYVDADPSRPCVIAHDERDAPGWMPLFVELGGEGLLPVACATDPIVAGPFGGTIVGVPRRIRAGL